MDWDLSVLDRFKKRIENDLDDAKNYAAIGTSRSFDKSIRIYYSTASVTVDDADYTPTHTSVTLNVHDKDLWFNEFGTGFDGQAKGYIGNLPTTPLSFVSRGAQQTTSGWEYAYHPQTKIDGGWWYHGKFYTGQAGKMGFAIIVNRMKAHGIPTLADFVREHMGDE